jgi:hypothetical protein
MEIPIFHHEKNNVYKKSFKKNQTPLRYHNSIINLIPSFNRSHNIIFQKSSYKKNLLHGQNPLSYYIL